jgi:hypothetical protein
MRRHAGKLTSELLMWAGSIHIKAAYVNPAHISFTTEFLLECCLKGPTKMRGEELNLGSKPAGISSMSHSQICFMWFTKKYQKLKN